MECPRGHLRADAVTPSPPRGSVLSFPASKRRHPPRSPVPGPHVDDPVAGRDDHGIAGVDQRVQLCHELVDIGGMLSDGRFIDDIERRASLNTLQLGRKLDPLCFATRELGGWLTQPKVSETDFLEERQGMPDVGGLGEELAGFIHRHFQHLGVFFHGI
jgi:hypothetical protein